MSTTISEKQNDVPLVFALICFVEVSILFMLFVFINVYWLPTRFPYHMSFYSNTTDTTSGAGIAYPYGAP